MELKQYWSVVRARLWLVVLLGVAAFAISAVSSGRATASYKASVRIATKPQVEARVESFGNYSEYYAYVSSEYLNDDIGKLVEGPTFMNDLRKRALRETGRAPIGSLEVKKAHRLVTIESTSSTADDALLLARVAGDMLADPQATYFDLLSVQNPRVTPVDPPTIISATTTSRVALDIAVRTVLALLVGVALAFFLDYLDDTIRNRAQLEEQLGFAVLGEVPQR